MHRFSPTGFYSSAVRNNLLRALEGRSVRQVDFRRKAGVDELFNTEVAIGRKKYFVKDFVMTVFMKFHKQLIGLCVRN